MIIYLFLVVHQFEQIHQSWIIALKRHQGSEIGVTCGFGREVKLVVPGILMSRPDKPNSLKFYPKH